MKFSHVLVALVATVSQAQPIEERDATAAPRLFNATDSEISARDLLLKRADVTFLVFPNDNCGSGGTLISGGAGAKGNFSPKQESVMLQTMLAGAGYHLSLYTGLNQRPEHQPNLRLNEGNIGQCWYFDAGWLSYGIYNS